MPAPLLGGLLVGAKALLPKVGAFLSKSGVGKQLVSSAVTGLTNKLSGKNKTPNVQYVHQPQQQTNNVQNASVSDWLKNNVLVVALGSMGLAFLIFKAFNPTHNRRR